jgi:hypothetical protein
VGPLKLSTHPLRGSFILERTDKNLLEKFLSHFFLKLSSPIDGRTIANGRFPASFISMASARAFVKVYVFGRLPISDGVNWKWN